MTKKQKPQVEAQEIDSEEDAAEEAITVDLQLETLSGDIRDEMLKRIRLRKVAWSMMTEQEQNEEIEGLGMLARQLVRRAVALLTKHDFPHAVVTLVEFKVKGGKDIEAKITCPNIWENREALGDRTGQMCLLMMVDSEEFFGERETPQADPDQPGLDLPVAPDEESAPKALPKPSADPQSPEDEN